MLIDETNLDAYYYTLLFPPFVCVKTEDDEIWITYALGAVLRAVIEWDISHIPLSATILAVSFNYHGIENSAENVAAITRFVTDQPSSLDCGTLYTQIHDNDVYQADWELQIGENQSFDLCPAVVSDLQAALGTRTWFALGFFLNIYCLGTFRFYSSRYGSAVPKPTLSVSYSLPGSFGTIID